MEYGDAPINRRRCVFTHLLVPACAVMHVVLVVPVVRDCAVNDVPMDPTTREEKWSVSRSACAFLVAVTGLAPLNVSWPRKAFFAPWSARMKHMMRPIALVLRLWEQWGLGVDASAHRSHVSDVMGLDC